MLISEIFSSIQGEGVWIGKPATFIRLQLCGLRCTFCDSKYTWTPVEGISCEEVQKMVYEVDPHPSLIILTGGEPLLQASELGELLENYIDQSAMIAVETNGTILLDERDGNQVHLLTALDRVTISPKLKSAVEKGYEIRKLKRWLRICEQCEKSAELKFVVTSLDDAREMAQVVDALSTEILDYGIPVILQPDGQTDDYPTAMKNLVTQIETLREEVPEFEEFKPYIRVLPQLQRVIWGKNARGI